MADELGIMLDGMGAPQKITLDLVYRFTRQELELGGAFDALRYDRQTQAMRKADYRAHDGRGLTVILEVRK
jgi:hypothetical protein